ncbi:heme-binding protein 2-like isoform X2 [Haliotis rubra]|uniref:heme-binding protein 2-like isoform X2 n=1 Tax=Haliotis rubra TaxID=36100 RepID=UPI001EE56CB1|nr:heme-binding protein 2-like isoform X2 [Haliotis rubra]
MKCGIVFVLMATCVGALPHTSVSCDRSDCATFEVIREGEGFQLRRYGPSKWVSARGVVTRGNWLAVKRSLFLKLYDYIHGANDQSIGIPMTAPVVTRVEPETPVFQHGSLTMFFMVPFTMQENTPNPLGLDLTIVEWPAKEVYVREQTLTQLSQLRSAIGDPTLYDNSYFYKAEFDPPSRRANRHNEVWLAKN